MSAPLTVGDTLTATSPDPATGTQATSITGQRYRRGRAGWSYLNAASGRWTTTAEPYWPLTVTVVMAGSVAR